MIMDWTKVKSAVVQIAPWVAGTLGSPVAGVAVKAICDVFGLSSDTATPENVIAALSGASPDQLQALRDAETKHAEFMQQIGYSHLEKLEQATVDDRSSARLRERSVKDNTPKVLAALAVIVFFALVIFVAIGRSPEAAMQSGFWMLAGAAIATYKDVYGYYFGSSHGSDRKNDTIAEALKGDDAK